MTATGFNVDEALLDEITSALTLRAPNREATESIAASVSYHLDVLSSEDTFEGVVDAATGVGKTYTMAATIDYLAQSRGWTDFVVVVPGDIVRTKTIADFTAGNPRSLLGGMGVGDRLRVVTADNFETAAATMADPSLVKVYVLTVQGLMAPANSDARKRTHVTQESFGAAFYERLRQVENLVVLADEHHAYYGPQFSKAVRELEPRILIGLTATPHKKTPPELVIYRYPLAAAVGERYVKTPVLVGRSDDRFDVRTRLLDGLSLLEEKRAKADKYADALGKRINPVMLVVAEDTAEADRLAATVQAPDFKDGRYAGAVLVVHSKVKAEQEAAEYASLQDVEHPDSPIRVVISVNMLKEGWDVKNVYVLLVTRVSTSDLLTEQVLGRGLRLPYGEYTNVELLDTLEVLAHERYEEMLKKAGVLREEYVSFKTRIQVGHDDEGNQVYKPSTEEVDASVVFETAGIASTPTSPTDGTSTSDPDGAPAPTVVDAAARLRAAEQSAQQGPLPVARRAAELNLMFPRLTSRPVVRRFSLTDLDPAEFERIGRKIASNPSEILRRTKVDAVVEHKADGSIVTRTRTEAASDQVMSHSDVAVDVAQAKTELVQAILGSDVVSSQGADASKERGAAGYLVDAFVDGLNGDLPSLLAAYKGRITGRLLRELVQQRKACSPPPEYTEAIDFVPFGASRTNAREVSGDLTTKLPIKEFRARAYKGWTRSWFELEWFDSHPERDVARLLDAQHNPIKVWVRLQQGDLVIKVNDAQTYHPDFVAVDTDDVHWIIEVKDDVKARTDQDVKRKREAAGRWCRNVNARGREFGQPQWRYVLVTESDIAEAKDDWKALVKFASAS